MIYPPPSPPKRDPTPLDVIGRIATYLHTDDARATLASLTAVNKATYVLLLPLLYSSLLVSSRSLALFDLRSLDAVDSPDLLDTVQRAFHEGTLFDPKSPARKIAALNSVQSMTIRNFPDEVKMRRYRLTAKLLAMASEAGSSSSASSTPSQSMQSKHLLFPNLSTVTIEPYAMDALRTFTPETYDKPHSPAFLEALSLSSVPETLNLSFRVAPSHRWEEHCSATSSGAYNLVSRLNTLHASTAWSSLRHLNVSGIVHQVLPSLLGCSNTYTFSPHLLFPDREMSGKEGINIPGPHWSFRAWQIMTAIKNVFPSGTPPGEQLDSTSWCLRNISGHVLKKAKTDGDDETGVGWDEVDGLIQACVKGSLPQDLPIRHGFSGQVVDQILNSIEYA